MKLNLGCGLTLLKGFINIDLEYPDNIDFFIAQAKGTKFIRRDITRGLPFSNNSIDEIRAISVLEHLDSDDFLFVMNECWRVLKEETFLIVKVPYWKSDACWRDPTHKRGFSLNTIRYFDQMSIKHYPTYGFMPWNIINERLMNSRHEKESIINWVLSPYKKGDWKKYA